MIRIYSQKLSAEQNAACQKMEAVLGLPPANLEDLDAGLLTPAEFWRVNCQLVSDINATVQNINFPCAE